MNKDLPEKKENESQDSQTNDDFLSEWSNIDATSIYRKGSELEKPVNKNELNKIVNETNSFLKIGLGMLIFVLIIIFISRYL